MDFLGDNATLLGWLGMVSIAILWRWNRQLPPLRDCIASPRAESSPSDVFAFLLNVNALALAGMLRKPRRRPRRCCCDCVDDDFPSSSAFIGVNPASGLMMADDVLDIGGNLYGCSSSD